MESIFQLTTRSADAITALPWESPNWGDILAALAMLAALIAVGLVSVHTRFDRRAAKGVGSLFLKVSYAFHSKNLTGYLRSLSPGNATILSREPLGLGDKILLDLDSLPNFPASHCKLEAHIVQIGSLPGDNANQLFHLKFDLPIYGRTGDSLRYYVQSLLR